MGRRALLRPDDRRRLFGAAEDEEGVIRHYSLTLMDRAEALSRRRPHNQLGFAVQLCLMRHPGRMLVAGEEPPRAMLDYVADQLGLDAGLFRLYGRRDETRLEHGRRLQAYLALRSPTRDDRRAALLAGIEAAEATDRGEPIVTALIEAFRRRAVLLPAAGEVERLALAARAMARRRANAALLWGMTDKQLAAIDGLLEVDATVAQTRFGWLRAAPEGPGDQNLLGLVERLAFVRALGLDPSRRDLIHPERFRQLAREGEVSPSWLVADFNPLRRRTIITAQVLELATTLTDAAVIMFIKLMARLFARAKALGERRHLDRRRETAEALHLLRDTLRALLTARAVGADPIRALEAAVGWERLREAQPSVEALMRGADPDALLLAVERYAGLRRYAPAFLEAFAFRSFRRHDPLLGALDVLRTLNREGHRALPIKAPVGHLAAKTRALIFGAGTPDRRLYEIATLAVLRERLRTGNVWVEGSRAFRRFDDHLLPKPAFLSLREGGALTLGVPTDVDAYLAEARSRLDFALRRLAWRARMGRLDGVRLENGVLVVTPPRGETPWQAEELKWTLNHALPRIGITDLLVEVDGWTRFSERFTHLHTQEPVRNPAALLAAILGDATNLGPKRMAEASAGVTERQVTWASLFHVRAETHSAAQAAIIDAHATHPHARLWGSGATSSSDGQFFRAGDRGGLLREVNARYGGDPGVMFYTHVSDQYGHFHILPISPTESEAPYVLDGLLNHETQLEIEEHFADTGGATDHVFGLFALLGRRFAPRLRDLKDWRFYSFERGADAYPALKRHLGGVIDTHIIREAWDELLRLAASIEARTAAPSTLLKKLAGYPKQNQIARALREIGRIERTLFMAEWYSDPALRRRCQVGLNKGEAGHKLKRAVFFHERGEVRDRSFENQAFRASGLNLTVAAIVYWNTVYLSRAAADLRDRGHIVPDELLRHVSPQSWEHINLTGTYTWLSERLPPDTFRPLRDLPTPAAA